VSLLFSFAPSAGDLRGDGHMDYICAVIAGVALLAALLVAALALIMNTVIGKSRRAKAKNKEESSLKGIEAGIRERLHAVYPGSKWRWICRPMGFAVNGGIARIDVIESSGRQRFIDVCFDASSFTMTLHVLNAVLLTAPDTGVDADMDTTSTATISPDGASGTAATPPDGVLNTASFPISAVATIAGTRPYTRPYDTESLNTWYNIVLIDALTEIVGNLNAEGEACRHISQDGKAYTYAGAGADADESESAAAIYDFGELPDIGLWSHIINRLGDDGLFAEVREVRNENCIFISWV
jgi:hypothetical protein